MKVQTFNRISGDDGYVVPPVPIPNTVVKHINAESTWLETAWEDRKLPVKKEDCLLTVLFFIVFQAVSAFMCDYRFLAEVLGWG